jgi:hypothetical protein
MLPFTLRAQPILVTGDGKAIAQAIGTKSPGKARKGCRMCKLVGVQDSHNHFYYPHNETTNSCRHRKPARGDRICQCPRRRSFSCKLYWSRYLDWYCSPINTAGHPGPPLPSELPSGYNALYEPEYTQILHAFVESTVLPNPSLDRVLSEKLWQTIDASLSQCRSQIPTYVGAAPRSTKTCLSWTSSEFHAFFSVYGVPALKVNLNPAYADSVMRF